MIVVDNIHKRFSQNEVLKGVSLQVSSGKTRVILGLSGSGKSVLMKAIIGLLKPDLGSISIDGEEITRLKKNALLKIRRKFGMVFQQAALFDSMTVHSNVAFPLREHTALSPSEINTLVLEKLELVGLKNAAQKYPAELSGGMKKRVGLARASVRNPSIILYDEPTTGLDPLTTDNVDQMILDTKKNLNVTSLVISHDVGSALKIADNIAVIHQGKIVEDWQASEIRVSKHPFVQNFLNTWFNKQ